MASGRSNKLIGQVGEFLVCAELGRLGFVATSFSGNVPQFDVIATNERCESVPIQVKTINGGGWQHNVTDWLDLVIDDTTGVQTIRGLGRLLMPNLIHVFDWLDPKQHERDAFFVCTMTDVQQLILQNASEFLGRHGGLRPRKPKSTHGALTRKMFARFENNWALITHRLLRGAPDGQSAPMAIHAAGLPEPKSFTAQAAL